MRFMVFDVESVGLHGEGFAVGWVVVDGGKVEIERWAACRSKYAHGPPEGRRWIKENLPDHVLDFEEHHVQEEDDLFTPCGSPRTVRSVFWHAWMSEKDKGSTLWADCAWPVEARFLAGCVDDGRSGKMKDGWPQSPRAFDGPYPLHEIATARMMAGFDPTGSEERTPTSELPKHHPLADARQSAGLLGEALGVLEARRLDATP